MRRSSAISQPVFNSTRRVGCVGQFSQVLGKLVNGFVACSCVYSQVFQCVVVVADLDSVAVEEGHGDKKRGALVAIIKDVASRDGYPVLVLRVESDALLPVAAVKKMRCRGALSRGRRVPVSVVVAAV